MDAVIVACPHCRRDLKLNDRSKLGRRVKCPGCGESIVLQEKPLDDEPVVTLLEPPAPAFDLPKLERGESYKAKKQRRQGRGRILWLAGGLVAAAGIVVAVMMLNSNGKEPEREQAANGQDGREDGRDRDAREGVRAIQPTASVRSGNGNWMTIRNSSTSSTRPMGNRSRWR
jgi:hypothetical protein